MSAHAIQDRSAHSAVDLGLFCDLSIDLLCIAGFDGYFKYVNPAWEATLGWTVEEMTTQPWSSFVHPDDLDRTIEEANSQTERGFEAISFENRYRAKDGVYHWLKWNSRPNPARQEMHAMARDVTGEKRSEQALLQLNARLEQEVIERTIVTERRATDLAKANADIAAFTYSISHDLKEPLRTLEAFSQFLLSDHADQLDPQGKDYLVRIARASSRMKLLIEDVLAVSRIGKFRPAARVDLGGVLAEVAVELRTELTDCKGQLDIQPHVPDAQGDRARLSQVFRHLISNALKFNRSGAPFVTVGAGLNGAGETVCFVRDNGIGIAPEFHQKIFEMFQRLNRREEYEGRGAGLTLVKRAVEAMGGSVWVESALDEGATFLFTLPAGDAAALANAAA